MLDIETIGTISAVTLIDIFYKKLNGNDLLKFVLIKPSFDCFLFAFAFKVFLLDDLQPSCQELGLSSSVTYTLFIQMKGNVKQQKR